MKKKQDLNSFDGVLLTYKLSMCKNWYTSSVIAANIEMAEFSVEKAKVLGHLGFV